MGEDEGLVFAFLAVVIALFFGVSMLLYWGLGLSTTWNDDKRAIVAFSFGGVIIKAMILAVCLAAWRSARSERH